jgi:hypothetical protein
MLAGLSIEQLAQCTQAMTRMRNNLQAERGGKSKEV